MRIGLVVYGDLTEVTGGNVYDHKLVEHLRACEHDVELIAFPHGSYARHLTQNYSVPQRRKLLGASLDIVVQDELTHPSLVGINQRMKRKGGPPLVAIVHHLRTSEEWPERQARFYRKVELRYLQTIDAFVFNSETTRESVEELLQKKTRNIVATPGGDRLPALLSRARVSARAREDGDRRLLFVGNLIRRKGLHVLLDALAKLDNDGWHLDVVGRTDASPDYVRDVQRQCAAHGLSERVRFLGALDGDALAERYRSSHVLVVPSLYEGFGIVYLEAMGFGLPVIAGGGGASDEIVQHEVTGLLVQPHDVFGLTVHLTRLVEDRDLLERLSLTAFEAFHSHPSWEQSMAAIESFLIDVAAT